MTVILPQPVSDAELAFPATVAHLLPLWDEIPREFRRSVSKHPAVKLTTEWFFNGLPDGFPYEPKRGVDRTAALRHLGACLGSFQPKHEHKIAGVAYLISEWFEVPQ